MEHLTDNKPDVVFLTETWLTLDQNNKAAEVKDYGYEFLQKIWKNREKERGGGVGMLVKSTMSAKPVISKD